eukprot:Tbor_TRINITY_DN2234_c0_g1::TRINITY_DN2234_c0_g1_i1::g.2690::m.2690
MMAAVSGYSSEIPKVSSLLNSSLNRSTDYSHQMYTSRSTNIKDWSIMDPLPIARVNITHSNCGSIYRTMSPDLGIVRDCGSYKKDEMSTEPRDIIHMDIEILLRTATIGITKVLEKGDMIDLESKMYELERLMDYIEKLQNSNDTRLCINTNTTLFETNYHDNRKRCHVSIERADDTGKDISHKDIQVHELTPRHRHLPTLKANIINAKFLLLQAKDKLQTMYNGGNRLLLALRAAMRVRDSVRLISTLALIKGTMSYSELQRDGMTEDVHLAERMVRMMRNACRDA